MTGGSAAHLGGQAAATRDLLAGFPAESRAADAELAALAAAGEVTRGPPETAERYLEQAARRTRRSFLEFADPVRGRRAAPGARRRAGAPDRATLSGVHRPGAPGSYQGHAAFARAAEYNKQAIGLAERHGWTDEPAAGIAYVMFGGALVGQGRLKDAEPWVQRGERTVRADAEPAEAVAVHSVRRLLELARGHDAHALTAFRAAERLAARLAVPRYLVPAALARRLEALVRLGEIEHAEHVLLALSEQDRDRGEIRAAVAALRLAQGDPRAATVALAPVLEGSAPVVGCPDLARSVFSAGGDRPRRARRPWRRRARLGARARCRRT